MKSLNIKMHYFDKNIEFLFDPSIINEAIITT